ncbi:hypothetical protein AB0D38_18145 [Streptomyces sp. NPDC048279]|uniref:LiaF transmembrane domain-containing protein n=1 Tax=Streptomyces sp. NPDC048279 TaxID=3154714 RepID=UPI00341A69FD
MRSHLRIWIALALFAVGLTALVDRLAPSAHVLAALRDWWPLALVVLGLGGALRLLLATKNVLRGPLVVAVVGALLLVLTRDPLPPSVRPYVWPLALLFAGTFMLAGMAATTTAARGLLVTRLVSVAEARRVVWPQGEFSLATVMAFASGCVIDLRKAQLHENVDANGRAWREARLEVTAVLSGVDILVPHGWEWTVERYSSHWRQPPVGPPEIPERQTLHIKALALLGGIEIRRVAEIEEPSGSS